MKRTCLAVLLAVLATGCGGSSPKAGGRLDVEAAFYPLVYLAQAIGGPDVDVTGLTKAGAEPHEIELSPRQAARLTRADLVVLLKGFQPAVDDAAGQGDGRVLDVAKVQPLEGHDPHVWLDPRRFSAIAEALTDELVRLLPSKEAGIRARAKQLTDDLAALDQDYRAGLTGCARTQIVTSHAAFGYLARAYGLEQVGITGLTPDQEPSPARLAEVARFAQSHHVTTIFFEDLVSPKTAEALADEVGARAQVLSPIESKPKSGDYLTQMRANLSALRAALGCR